MQMEIDILKETINVLKRVRCRLESLKNEEKTTMINVLKNKYSLSVLLKRFELSKGSYRYQEATMKRIKISLGNMSS